MAAKFKSKLQMSVTGLNPILDTSSLFDAAHKEPKISPIDEFSERIISLNKLSPIPTNYDPHLGQLILLGVIAAVESYIRAIFRKLVIIDVTAQECVHDRQVSYGAALHLSKELLPEALFERLTFISRKNIVEDGLRDCLGIKGAISSELEQAMTDYLRICQIRHCAVHRFGRLGANNAIALGLSNHVNLIEKPLKISYTALQNGIAISFGFVKTLNNVLCNEFISRVPFETWSGNYSKDKQAFIVYYNLFSNKKTIHPTPAPKIVYLKLIGEIKTWRLEESGGTRR